jgi:xanthine/uracil permease
LVLQELMGILIAAVFVTATYYLPALRRRWVLAGLAYGVVIFFVMNYVVVPLSAWRRMPHFTPVKFAANLLAMLLFGLIVAYFARRQRATVSTVREAPSSQHNSLADPGA